MNTITRAEFITIIARGLDLDEPSKTTKFDDEALIGTWAKEHVQAMYAKGYIKGDTTGGKLKIRPNDPISRAEAVTIIGRIFTQYTEKAALNYKDKNQIPVWSADYFAYLVKGGVINGYEDNTLKPLGNITRAETAKILAKVYE